MLKDYGRGTTDDGQNIGHNIVNRIRKKKQQQHPQHNLHVYEQNTVNAGQYQMLTQRNIVFLVCIPKPIHK